MVLGSVSTRGRSATHSIAGITVYVKSRFISIRVTSFVLPVSFLVYTFSYHFPILSLLIRRKIKEGLRKVQGTKFGSICLCISYIFPFYFLLRKGREYDIIWVKKERRKNEKNRIDFER